MMPSGHRGHLEQAFFYQIITASNSVPNPFERLESVWLISLMSCKTAIGGKQLYAVERYEETDYTLSILNN